MMSRFHFRTPSANTFWPSLCSLIVNRKPKVLVAEDDTSVSTMMCLLLKEQDFDVRVAETGLEALQMAQSWKPDIMVLDINLPQMSGLEICRMLKTDPKTSMITIVFCSGEGHLAAEAMAMGGTAFLEKPAGILQLTPCLRGILSGDRRFDVKS